MKRHLYSFKNLRRGIRRIERRELEILKINFMDRGDKGKGQYPLVEIITKK